MKIKFTKHARKMLTFRRIKRVQVEETIKNSEDRSTGKSGKDVLYKNFGKNYLKVVISKEEGDVFVITEHWIAKKRIKK
ncbi:hypothetical protein A3D81_00635 [Candidatus Curtissbacteria bacterium RIFCSPHIGHO2_02_FULL_40_17]|uniref:DUF4258 domain-containing protein n=1 Tax=Candidatus Curtissbacteria bacterium RIFCSPHIGHO2_02_FULL_40_17 TaxID=1797715 RepID=A0A1F5GG51_9BACT|nr:MAG: hypothetical protein A3D81_00635 [Candidatus Curtissbacteria bacterium RIFCSPHIGHO2_02_FULL_40_17]